MRTAGRGGRSRMIPAKLRRAVVVIKRRRGARDQMVPALASSAQLVAFGITSPKPLAHFLLIPELELIQPHMAQEPVPRGEVGACVARAVSVERGGMGERGFARRMGG